MERRSEVSAVPSVETRALGKRYGTTIALDDVRLDIQAGESVALVGQNGAGKSTLVRLPTGLHRPDSGEIRFIGEPAPDLPARAAWRSKVACVYQKSTIIPDLGWREPLSQRSAEFRPRSDPMGVRFAGKAAKNLSCGDLRLTLVGAQDASRSASGNAENCPLAAAGREIHHSR